MPEAMNALDALHQRTSAARLTDPAPDAAALANIYKAALRAADHGALQPWRFLVVRGKGRERLGELFVTAARSEDARLPPGQQEKLRRKPLRAPLIIVTIASVSEHPLVPVCEQEFSAAAATQNMLVAAFAQGVGAMWRTGSMAFHPVVMQGLGLAPHEKIIGFLYLGTRAGPVRALPESDPAGFFAEWPE